MVAINKQKREREYVQILNNLKIGQIKLLSMYFTMI